MDYISIFSGIESVSCAWEPLGFQALVFSEIDKYASAVLAAHYPHIPNLGDITKIDWSIYHGKADIVVGGSPCQSFSIAGTRTGLRGESGLMWEYVRCVSEVMPRWLVWENVPGALSSTHGEDFRCLLRALDDLGYGLAWRVLDAQFFGVAQRRRRVFLVGSLGDIRSAEVLFESEGLCWDSPSSREKRGALAAGVGKRAEGGLYTEGDAISALNPRDPQSKRVYSPDGVSPTLSSGTGEGMNIQPSVLQVGCFNGGASISAAGVSYSTEHSPTLKVGNAGLMIPCVCMSDTQSGASVGVDAMGTLTRHAGKDAPVVYMGEDGAPRLPDGREFVLRRLMPVECERLQGFPDGWTDIPYRDKEHPSDTQRYKALGNSMAVPVMRWIGERLMEVNFMREKEEK